MTEFMESPDLVAARAALNAADEAFGVEVADGVRLGGHDHMAVALATATVAQASALERIATCMEQGTFSVVVDDGGPTPQQARRAVDAL